MSFQNRHIGPNSAETAEMLAASGFSSFDALINATVPAHIRLKQPMDLPPAIDEAEMLVELKKWLLKINFSNPISAWVTTIPIRQQ